MRSHVFMHLVMVFAVCTSSLIAPVYAQSDAQEAFQKAKVAFENDQFASARDLLVTASQTDAKNPDIFLLLGKAHYQLGDVDKAIVAWQRTLQLAPAQAYAKRMVTALQGKVIDVDVRIQIVKSLLADYLTKAAQSELA